MENKFDFQTDDKVYCLIFGKGFISDVTPKNNIYVKFDDEFACLYDIQGCLIEIIEHKKEETFKFHYYNAIRTLYHYKPEINIIETKPIRTTWVNLYRVTDENAGRINSIICGIEFITEEKAKKSTKGIGGAKYIKTVKIN